MATRPSDSARPVVRLYVSNVSPLATDEELGAAVKRIAPIERIRMIRNMVTGLGARFAFLDVAPEHEAAIREGLDGAMFMGRILGVLEIRERPDRPGPDGV